MKSHSYGWAGFKLCKWLKGLCFCLVATPFLASIACAQEVRPFTNEAERQFRSELEQFRTQSERTPEQQTRDTRLTRGEGDNSLYNDPLAQPLTTYEQDRATRGNRIEATDRGSEFDDNPFATRRRQDRFEPNGGELRNIEINTESRRGSSRRETNLLELSTGNRENRGDRPLNQDTIEDRDAIAELEGRNNNDQNEENRFEEEFLAAERELEDDQEQPININPQNLNVRQANNQNNRRVQGRTAQGQQDGRAQRQGVQQGQRNALQQMNQNQAELNFANNNDITGSIRNNELEDTFAAEGKRIGSFLIFSEVTLTGLYSDNPTASVQNGPGDEALEIIPNIVLQSDWARHSLQLQGQITKSYYEELSSENIDEFVVSAIGRIDIQTNHFLELQVRKEQTQDSRGDIDNLNSDAELANLDTLFLSAIYNHEWNKTTLRLTGTITDFDYEDVTDGLGNLINNDDQDYLEKSLTARLAYTVHSGLYVYVEGNYIEREYEAAQDDDGFQRGNEEQNYRIGLIHDLTSKIRFEASIGYQALFADDARFIDVEDMVYEASLNFRPTRQTTLVLSTSKSYDATDIAGTIAVEETNYSIALNHYFQPKIRMNAALSHEEEIFEGINQSQKTLTAELNLEYIFNRHTRLIAGYEFTDVSTNDGGDYQENQFRIGLNLRP